MRLAELFPGPFYQLATKQIATGSLPVVACPAIHYAVPEDRMKYDIVQSIRTLTLLRQNIQRSAWTGDFISALRSKWWQPAKAIRLAGAFAGNCRTLQFRNALRQAAVPGVTCRRTVRRRVNFFTSWSRTVCADATAIRAGSMRPQIEQELGIIMRGRLRGILSGRLEYPARLPGTRHRMDHARQRGGFARLLLPRHLRRLPDSLRPLLPAVSERGAHGAEQAAGH
jgi:hypothetical protein